MQGETEFDTDTKGVKVRERLRGNKAELSWLMRTSYISNETESRRQAAAPRATASEAVDQSLDADEAHLQAAEVRVALHLCQGIVSKCLPGGMLGMGGRRLSLCAETSANVFISMCIPLSIP